MPDDVQPAEVDVPQPMQAVRSLETPKFREGEQLEIEGSGSRGQVPIDDVGKALEE